MSGRRSSHTSSHAGEVAPGVRQRRSSGPAVDSPPSEPGARNGRSIHEGKDDGSGTDDDAPAGRPPSGRRRGAGSEAGSAVSAVSQRSALLPASRPAAVQTLTNGAFPYGEAVTELFKVKLALQRGSSISVLQVSKPTHISFSSGDHAPFRVFAYSLVEFAMMSAIPKHSERVLLLKLIKTHLTPGGSWTSSFIKSLDKALSALEKHTSPEAPAGDDVSHFRFCASDVFDNSTNKAPYCLLSIESFLREVERASSRDGLHRLTRDTICLLYGHLTEVLRVGAGNIFGLKSGVDRLAGAEADSSIISSHLTNAFSNEPGHQLGDGQEARLTLMSLESRTAAASVRPQIKAAESDADTNPSAVRLRQLVTEMTRQVRIYTEELEAQAAEADRAAPVADDDDVASLPGGPAPVSSAERVAHRGLLLENSAAHKTALGLCDHMSDYLVGLVGAMRYANPIPVKHIQLKNLTLYSHFYSLLRLPHYERVKSYALPDGRGVKSELDALRGSPLSVYFLAHADKLDAFMVALKGLPDADFQAGVAAGFRAVYLNSAVDEAFLPSSIISCCLSNTHSIAEILGSIATTLMRTPVVKTDISNGTKTNCSYPTSELGRESHNSAVKFAIIMYATGLLAVMQMIKSRFAALPKLNEGAQITEELRILKSLTQVVVSKMQALHGLCKARNLASLAFNLPDVLRGSVSQDCASSVKISAGSTVKNLGDYATQQSQSRLNEDSTGRLVLADHLGIGSLALAASATRLYRSVLSGASVDLFARLSELFFDPASGQAVGAGGGGHMVTQVTGGGVFALLTNTLDKFEDAVVAAPEARVSTRSSVAAAAVPPSSAGGGTTNAPPSPGSVLRRRGTLPLFSGPAEAAAAVASQQGSQRSGSARSATPPHATPPGRLPPRAPSMRSSTPVMSAPRGIEPRRPASVRNAEF